MSTLLLTAVHLHISLVFYVCFSVLMQVCSLLASKPSWLGINGSSESASRVYFSRNEISAQRAPLRLFLGALTSCKSEPAQSFAEKLFQFIFPLHSFSSHARSLLHRAYLVLWV